MPKTKKPGELRRFIAYYKPYKAAVAADVLSAAAVGAAGVAFPLIVRGAAAAADAADPVGELALRGALMLLLVAASTALGIYYDYRGHVMGAAIERDMRLELFSRYQRLPLSFFDSSRTGELMSRLTDDLLGVAELCHHLPENLAVYGIQFLGSAAALFIINPALALAAFALLPALGVYSHIVYQRLERAYAENRRRIADLNSRAEDNISGARTVRAFMAGEFEISRFRGENERFFRARSEIYKYESYYHTVISRFFLPLILAVTVTAGALRVAAGALELPDLLAFVMYLAYLTEPVRNLAFMMRQYREGMAGFARFLEIMALPVPSALPAPSAPPAPPAPSAPSAPKPRGRVEFRNVAFRYGGGEYVLRNVSFTAEPGSTLAVAGRSGIGKTTLCSLILRFYDDFEGEILIDGTEIRHIPPGELSRLVGYVTQDSYLFSGTVLDNILYGSPDASRADALRAAVLAGAHEFISSLPDGYDTEVGRHGARLSGGQRQRVCIARVFLKNPPLLLLDEATSALDLESERGILDSLALLSKGRTVIIAAHRPAALAAADRVIVLTPGGTCRPAMRGEFSPGGGE